MDYIKNYKKVYVKKYYAFIHENWLEEIEKKGEEDHKRYLGLLYNLVNI